MEDGYVSGTSCGSHGPSSADKEKKKTSASIKKWNERNTALLIYLMEERLSFWNMFNSEYTKREVRK